MTSPNPAAGAPSRCPSCGEDNPERARFCLACASPLPGAPGSAARERKFATALFADLVGSTALTEREDPEIVQSVVARAFDRLASEIEHHGGLVEKFMGDAVLAVFGVPTTHEDDPERAVRAALEMLALLAGLNRTHADEGKPQLEMRIGIEAGEVLVDLDRAAGPRDRMLTGDAVNTAARLQAAAEPRWIVVGSSVRAATKDVIDYLEIPPLNLKGKTEPVPAWRAMRVSARRRGERPRLGLEASLVGRDEELQLLEQTYQRVVSERRPALVTVIGPAGVGKSRLSSELLVYLETLPDFAYWRKGRCLAYGNVSYSALADAIKAQCEVLEDDPPDVLADKLHRAVEELFGDECDSVLPQIQALVGAAAADRTFAREELFEAWRRFLERMAARLPLVLVLEDLHWADAGLLDFVDHLADWAQGPLLVLTLARPELLQLRPAWGGGKRNYSSIYLDPLSADENGAMLDELLGSSLPLQLKQLITERSEGNPLYTEEIVRMFIDRGVLRRTETSRWELAQQIEDIEVPRSIQALIATRLDEPACGREGPAPRRRRDRPRVLAGSGGPLVGPVGGGRPRRPGTASDQGDHHAQGAPGVLRRAGVRLPPRPHPRRRLRVPAQGTPRGETHRGGAVGGGAGRRPQRGAGGGGGRALPGGGRVPGPVGGASGPGGGRRGVSVGGHGRTTGLAPVAAVRSQSVVRGRAEVGGAQRTARRRSGRADRAVCHNSRRHRYLRQGRRGVSDGARAIRDTGARARRRADGRDGWRVPLQRGRR